MLILVFAGCDSGKDRNGGENGEKPKISVVNYPLYYFAKEIGGEHASVFLPTISGDPAYWKPEANQILDFQEADLILANGAGYEKWMEKVSLPSSRIVNTSQAFKNRWIEVEEGVAHSHGPEGAHVHKGLAFTTWLDFDFAMLQASAVYEALCNLLPRHKQHFDDNFNRLSSSLQSLDKRMQLMGKNLDGSVLIASHPVYQYLEQAYALKIHSLHWEPGEMPDDDEWANLNKIMLKSAAKIMLWEGEPLESTKLRLQQLGLHVVLFDPCANRPDKGDFLSVMQENVSRLEHSAGL